MRTAFHHLLRDAAAAHSERPALTYKDTTVTYNDLWHQVQSVANQLQSIGISSGDRVAVYLEKRLETVIALFATSLAGAVFVPINPLLRPAQLAYILADCDVRVLITSPDRLALIEAEPLTPILHHVILVDDPGTRQFTHYDVTAWDQLTPSNLLISHQIDIDFAAILYTSGSTGKPKGVVLSHRNLLVGAESVSQYLANTADDVILAALPLSFDAGLSQITTAFAVGAHVILMNYLVARDVPKLCEKHRITGLTAVPPLWIQLAELTWPDAATQHLRYFANTGGRMPKFVLDRLRQHFPNALPFLMYGLTEAFRSTYLDPSEIDRRPNSIGKAIPNAEILVVRPDGSVCDANEEGELVHRGALVAQGYWGDPARTAERFRAIPGRSQPWQVPELAVFSGDIVTRDAEDFLYYVGRRDEMIKTSGYRVSPTEIEEAAYDTRLVCDAVAIGIADDRLGQRVVLIASAIGNGPLDTFAVIAHMKQHLPLYMVPSSVIARDVIPRSANGKFDRVLLREELGA